MALLPLKIIPNKILYEVSEDVEEDELGEELDQFMTDMMDTMYAHKGVGLSGVQVGKLKRVLVADLGLVRHSLTTEVGSVSGYGKEHIKMVNPEVIEESDEYVKASEGCLSYPSLEVGVKRPKWVVVKYLSPHGDEETERFEGFEARIILHEMDHFDGETIYKKISSFKRKRYHKKLEKSLDKIKESLRRRAQ